MEYKKYNSGIYQIVNIVNRKRYIGSSYSLSKREYEHFFKLGKNKHVNSKLQNSFNKHGKENFKFETLLYCSKEDLLFFEQRAIDSFDFKTLYNIRIKAESNHGLTHNQATRDLMSVSRCGKNNPMYGKEITEDHRNRLKQSHTNPSLEIRKRYRDSHIGKKLSQSTKTKLSIKHKGVKKTENHRKNISKAKIGEKNPNFKFYSDYDIIKMIELYNHDISVVNIGKIFSCCHTTVYKKIKEFSRIKKAL